MSLIAWYPLNGNLINQGIGDSSFDGSTSFSSSGKIGQCASLTTGHSLNYEHSLAEDISLSGWFYFDYSKIKPVVEALTYNNISTSATGCLLGYSSYKGVGVVWKTNNVYSDGTFSKLSVGGYHRDSSSASTAFIEIPDKTWVHYALVSDYTNKKINFYVNGNLSDIVPIGEAGSIVNLYLNYRGVYGGNGPATFIPFNCNDIRIYDHCLSAKEVSEIAKCKILHYPLNEIDGVIGGKNFVKNGDLKSTYTISSTSTKGEPVSAYNWGGYNGGISNPTTSYHAHIDSSTFGFNVYEFNETDGQRNWKSISQDITNVFQTGTEYTISADVYSTEIGSTTKIFGGFYYTKIGGTTQAFHSAWFYLTPTKTNTWQRLSCEVSYTTDIDTSKNIRLYIYGYNFSTNSIIYLKDIMLTNTLGTSQFLPYSEEDIDNTIYDVSGYSNHGTVTDTSRPDWSSDCKIGDGCYDLTDGSKNITIDGTGKLSFVTTGTVAFWAKYTNDDYKMIMTGHGAGSAGSRYIGARQSGGTWYHAGSGSSLTAYCDGQVYNRPKIDNQWHHYAFTGIDLSTWTTNEANIAYYNANFQFHGMLQDFRIYNTILSPENIKELYQTRYQVANNGSLFANEIIEQEPTSTNLLQEYIRAGSQTSKIDDYSIIVGTEVADTYFYLRSNVALTAGTTYTLSCDAINVPEGCGWGFGIRAQTNTNQIYIKNNGRNSLTFTLDVDIAADTDFILDDKGSRPTTAPNIILSNFRLVNGTDDTLVSPSFGANGNLITSSLYEEDGKFRVGDSWVKATTIYEN